MSTIAKMHSKFDCIEGSVVNSVRKPKHYSPESDKLLDINFCVIL